MPEILIGILMLAGSTVIGNSIVYVVKQSFWDGLLLAVIAGVTPVIIAYEIAMIKGREMAITFLLVYAFGIILGGVLQLKGWWSK